MPPRKNRLKSELNLTAVTIIARTTIANALSANAITTLSNIITSVSDT